MKKELEKSKDRTFLIPQNAIQSKILVFRGKNVILDRDLALLYEVKPIALRQQVKRNIERFPDDFMFQLTKKEASFLVSQNVIPSKQSLGGYLPYAFTENGVAMLSSVLKSKKAINVNIQIMRAFTKMREMLVNYQELKQRIESMERKVDEKSKVNSILFEEVFKEIEAVKRLLTPPEPLKKDEIEYPPVEVVNGPETKLPHKGRNRWGTMARKASYQDRGVLGPA